MRSDRLCRWHCPNERLGPEESLPIIVELLALHGEDLALAGNRLAVVDERLRPGITLMQLEGFEPIDGFPTGGHRARFVEEAGYNFPVLRTTFDQAQSLQLQFDGECVWELFSSLGNPSVARYELDTDGHLIRTGHFARPEEDFHTISSLPGGGCRVLGLRNWYDLPPE